MYNDEEKDREQLLREIRALQEKVEELERLDIEHKISTEAMLEHEKLCRLLVELSPVGICMQSRDGKYFYINPIGARFYGKKAAEIITKSPMELFPQDEAEEILKAIFRVFRENKIVQIEYSVPFKKGFRCLLTTFAPITNAAGNVISTLSIIFDLTERKKLEEVLQAAQAKAQNIIEQNPDAMVILDEEGNILFLNPAAEYMFARRKETLLGSSFGFPLVTAEAAQINIVCKSGEAGTGEMRIAAIEWSGKPAYLASIRDITEVKRMEALKAEIDERARLDQLKDEFVSTVSHELRTPLTTIKEFASIISDEIPGKLTKDQREYVGIIKGNIDRLARLINDILDISKIEAGKVQLNRAMTDIRNLVQGVIFTLKPQADEKHIELKAMFQKDIAEAYLDCDRMTQIFTNLIGNAIKFTPEKGKITVEIKDAAKEIECSVADTGIGIAPENLDKVFSKFQQFGRTAGPGAKGTGLGLTITKELIEKHSGSIWVESKLGKGTKFTFTLPKYFAQTLFKEYVTQRLDQAEQKGFHVSLMVISLAELKKINQEVTPKQIEIALGDIEDILTSSLRPQEGDFAFKSLGEVYVLLVDCSKENALRVEGRLGHVLEEYLDRKKLTGKINLSFSAATYPDDAQSTEELIEKAKGGSFNE